MRTLAEKVSRLRVRKGWSQERLASAAAIGASTIAHIELGTRTACQPGTLRALAGALAVPVDYLTSDDPALYLRIRLATLPDDEAAALGQMDLYERLRWALRDLEEKWGEEMALPALASRLGTDAAALEELLAGSARGGAANPALVARLAGEIGLPATFLLPSPALFGAYAEALALAAARGLSPEGLRTLILNAAGKPG